MSNWTRWGYAADWRRFVESCRAQPGVADKNPEDATAQLLASYLRWLWRRERYAPLSVRRAAYGVIAHLRKVRPACWPPGSVPAEVRAVLDELRDAMRAA